MTIGNRITALRKEQKISQGELAKLLDVSRQAVSKWENDLSAPDTIRLIKLANVLSTDVEYLATGCHSPDTSSYDKELTANQPTILDKEKIVEKPVYVDRVIEVERIVEKPVYVDKVIEVEKVVEIPVIRRIKRIKYLRNPIEYILIALLGLIAGLIVGLLLPLP